MAYLSNTIINGVLRVNGTASIDEILGNASSATKLKTPIKINGIEFDGTSDINLEVAATDNTKLPLSGGNLTGNLYLSSIGSQAAISASKIIFGTADTPYIYISSNNKNQLVISSSLEDNTKGIVYDGPNNNLRPMVNSDTTNLGASSNRWNNIYANKFIGGADFDNSIYLTKLGSISTSSTSNIIFGTEDSPYIVLRANTGKQLVIAGSLTDNTGAVTYTYGQNEAYRFSPADGQDNVITLGSAENRWKNVYSAAFTGNLIGSATSLASRGIIPPPDNKMDIPGLSVHEGYNNGWPETYGNIITIHGRDHSGESQLYLGWSGITGNYAKVWYRNHRDSAINSWSDWSYFLDSTNYTDLAIPKANVKSLTTNSNSNYDSDKSLIPDVSFISYWNGGWNEEGDSNLVYCIDGEIQCRPVILYYNKSGTNGSITLNDSVDYYNYFKLYYSRGVSSSSDATSYYVTNVYIPSDSNGKFSFDANTMIHDGTNIYQYTLTQCNFVASGNTLTKLCESHLVFRDSALYDMANSNVIYIYKVEGYK